MVRFTQASFIERNWQADSAEKDISNRGDNSDKDIQVHKSLHFYSLHVAQYAWGMGMQGVERGGVMVGILRTGGRECMLSV